MNIFLISFLYIYIAYSSSSRLKALYRLYIAQLIFEPIIKSSKTLFWHFFLLMLPELYNVHVDLYKTQLNECYCWCVFFISSHLLFVLLFSEEKWHFFINLLRISGFLHLFYWNYPITMVKLHIHPQSIA